LKFAWRVEIEVSLVFLHIYSLTHLAEAEKCADLKIPTGVYSCHWNWI